MAPFQNGDADEGAPVQLGTEYIIPDYADVITNLFRNSDKTCIPSYKTSELMEILKYENVFGFADPSVSVAVSDLGERFNDVDTVEFARTEDGKKYTLRIYENGFVLEGSAVSDEDKGKAFKMDDAAWNSFRKIILADYVNAESYKPYWLGLINSKNVELITFTDSIEGAEKEYCPDDVYFFYGITDILRSRINIKVPATFFDGNSLVIPSEKHIIIKVDFSTGTEYTLLVTEDKISMVSSDMSYGLTYDLTEDQNLYDVFLDYAKGRANPNTAKPVIYLYPERTTNVSVSLDFDGRLTYTYPAYNGGWNVTAEPDGTLTNRADGSTHYYLFLEGVADFDWPHESGFVVPGNETESFLRETLAEMGLTPREYNDFITYWVPKMQGNKYNLISFSGEEYSEAAKLTVSPAPDSVLRVHMVWMALDEPVDIPAQSFKPFERRGFTLAEWGGTEVFK